MKIENQHAIHAPMGVAGDPADGIRVASDRPDPAKKILKENANIAASGLRLGDNSVEARKEQARKQAMKIVGDAFDRERSMDRSLREIQDTMGALQKDLGERKQQIVENNEKLAALREQYGIEEGGPEDRALLRAARQSNTQAGMSAEEHDALSEYQQRALYYVSDNLKQERGIADDETLLAANVQARTDLKQERLKDHGMIDAQKEAEDIMDAAEKDAVSLLTQEAMEHLEEKTEEEKEAAKEKAEEEKEAKQDAAKKAEEQAKIDELNARIRANNEAEAAEAAARGRAARQERENAGTAEITDTAVQFDIRSVGDAAADSEVAGEVKNILNKLSLLSEDIKGISVDDIT